MAKITDEIKEKILADFHTGKFSQRELAKNIAYQMALWLIYSKD